MASSTLNLHILKGPKEGGVLTRKAGTQIRIGRVVKGNNFTIKDPAISQKHITILFDPEASKWVLEDLDTSNGTIVNEVKIKPLVQIPLSDGDVIKIGETTSISVKIEVDGEFGNNNLRRGRSKAKNNSKGLKKDDNLAVFVHESEKINHRRAGLRSRCGSKLAENVIPAVDDNLVLQKNAKRCRPKRAHSQTVNGVAETVVEDSVDKHENQKVGRKRKAPNTSQSPCAKVLKSADVENERLCANSDEKEGGLKENVETLVIDIVEEKENVEEMENVVEKENSEVKEDGEEETEKENDFEKMTLGEWFDSLKKYLPLAINEAAEAWVAELREQARQFKSILRMVSKNFCKVLRQKNGMVVVVLLLLCKNLFNN